MSVSEFPIGAGCGERRTVAAPKVPRRPTTGGSRPGHMDATPILPENNLPPVKASDLRSLGPTHQCVCGSTTFLIYASFYDYDVAWYGLDAECANCGNLVKVPCPIDKKE